MRFSTFTFQNADITTCKVMIHWWLQPTWFRITICFGIFIVIQVFATKLWRKKTLNNWKCLCIKAWAKTSCPHLRSSINEEFWKDLVYSYRQFSVWLNTRFLISFSCPPINSPKTICPPSAMKGFPPYFMGWDTMSLLHWKSAE